jgi:hypothetical protein
MIDRVATSFGQKRLRDRHGRAGQLAVDEDHQPAGIALDLCENHLIAIGGPGDVFGFMT